MDAEGIAGARRLPHFARGASDAFRGNICRQIQVESARSLAKSISLATASVTALRATLMNRFSLLRRLPLMAAIAFALSFLLASRLTCADDSSFDAWANKLAEAEIRSEPESATRSQYFSGDEQDKLDRELTPFTKLAPGREDRVCSHRPEGTRRLRPRKTKSAAEGVSSAHRMAHATSAQKRTV